MNTALLERIYRTWAKNFGITRQRLQQPGTTFITVESHEASGWILTFPVDQHAVILTPPSVYPELKVILAAQPDGYALSIPDILVAWGVADTEHEHDSIYVLDKDLFQPFTTPAPFITRQLTDADRSAFEAFLARCPEDDREMGDVSIDHNTAFGVFDEHNDGKRIVAAASTYIWRGFTDVGVLTDPEYRQRGLAKAVVSAVCEHLKDREEILVYRHAEHNSTSKRVAQHLALQLHMLMGSVRRKPR